MDGNGKWMEMGKLQRKFDLLSWQGTPLVGQSFEVVATKEGPSGIRIDAGHGFTYRFSLHSQR